MIRIFRKANFILAITLLFVSLSAVCFAGILDSWQDSKAYKPNPVLFLHGFAKGRPSNWDGTKRALSGYFSKYQPLGSYLETMDFQDSNGSVDTYDPGKLNPQGNSDGWSDKLEDKINEVLASSKYGAYTNKLNLVCHSMGGLAARWYLVNYSNNFVDKLILIGVPNLGSRWAELANAASKIPKVGWLNILTINGLASKGRDVLAFALWNLKEIDIYGEAVDDMDPTFTGSGFINKLNDRHQPSNIDYFGVIGIVGSWMNWVIAKDYYGGDCIVSKDSQLGRDSKLGINYVSYKEWAQINANHWQEIEVAGEGTFSPVLSFLDSTTPEFEITSPDPSKTTEIYETSIHIQGKVYKEYLPADSTLTINVFRQEDGNTLPSQTSLLKPSDLWIPNNPDSPVAEFDEIVNFPGKGTYKISCQIQNPAGLTSDIKDIWVKVIVQEGTYIIVHCHNPEGKEIASIQGMSQNSVEIYDGNTLIGYGAHNAQTHNKAIQISPGAHTIKAKFNGMTKEQTITLNPDETEIITFTFERKEFDLYSVLELLAGGDTVEFEKTKRDGGHEKGTISSPEKYRPSLNWYMSEYHKVDQYLYGKVVFYYKVSSLKASCHFVASLTPQDPEGFALALIGYVDDGDPFYHTPVLRSESLTQPNLVPSPEGFDCWYVQLLKEGDYPDIGLEENSTWLKQGDYRICTIHQAINSVSCNLPSGWAFACAYWFSDKKKAYDEFSISWEGSLSALKCSSVPYDLTGSGI